MTIGTISPFLFAINNRKSCLKRHLKNIILLNIDLCACVCARVRVCVLMNNKAIIRIKSIFLKGLNYSRTPLFRSPKGNGKKFEIAGFRNNRGSVKFITMKHFLIKYSTV